MIYLYRKYLLGYLAVGFFCAIICFGCHFVLKTPYLLSLLVFILLAVIDVSAFRAASVKKFTDEVLSHLFNCEVNVYLSKLDALMGNAKNKVHIANYNYFRARGYSALGRYEEMYECTKHITEKGEYLMRLTEYYVSKGQYDEARRYMNELSALAHRRKKKAYTDMLVQYIENMDYSIRILNGDYTGAVEHYEMLLEKWKDNQLLSIASANYALGNVLYLKGENDRAIEYLSVAAEIGGDTKFAVKAKVLLQKLSQNR